MAWNSQKNRDDEWKFICGNEESDVWAKISPDGTLLLKSYYETIENNCDMTKRTIKTTKVINIANL